MRRLLGPAVAATLIAAAIPASANAAPAPTWPEPEPVTRPTAPDHRFPVAGCRSSYRHAHHHYPATDVFARRGCRFVAPVAGRVTEVSRSDTWRPSSNRGRDRGGLAVTVVGVDGVRYYGSHLSKVASSIRPGVEVAAGRTLGRVGGSGSARGTGPHLHFGISWPTRDGVWWIRRGVVAPGPFLDSWRRGGDRSPAKAVQRARDRVGSDVPPCRTYC